MARKNFTLSSDAIGSGDEKKSTMVLKSATDAQG